MANQRQRKKDTKKQQLKTVSEVLGITFKEAKKLPTYTLKDIVTQTEKREKARNQYQARKQAKEAYIKENNLTGVKSGSTWDQLYKAKAEQEAAAKAADKAAKAAAKRQRTKERNQKMLEDAGIPITRYPKKWYEMGESRLNKWLENQQSDDRVINTDDPDGLQDVWLYIGHGDIHGGWVDKSKFTSGGYYGLRDNDTLRNDIKENAPDFGVTGSKGNPGDVIIRYGSYSDVRSEMFHYEFLGYQTIFFGNELTEHALLTYTAAAIDSCPEDNRKTIIAQINGYLNKGSKIPGNEWLKDLKIEVEFPENAETYEEKVKREREEKKKK